jgi:hypothetical protein
MAEFLTLPAEPTRDELDKLFALSGTAEPGPHDDEFYRVARRVVPKIQRLIMRLERAADVVGQEAKQRARKAQ